MWTESHLYLLRVVITQTGFDENSKEVPPEARESLRTAEAHLRGNTRLRTVLEAVKGKDHQLPTQRILQILQRKKAREALSFNVGIKGLLKPKSYYTPLLHDRDELVAVKAVYSSSYGGAVAPARIPSSIMVAMTCNKMLPSRLEVSPIGTMYLEIITFLNTSSFFSKASRVSTGTFAVTIINF